MTNVLITGCSRGLGLGLARGLLKTTDWSVVATARKPSESKDLTALKEKYGDRILLLSLDVEKDESIAAAVAKLRDDARFGRIDILINNAGVLTNHKALEETETSMKDVFNVNVIGPMKVTQAIFGHVSVRDS